MSLATIYLENLKGKKGPISPGEATTSMTRFEKKKIHCSKKSYYHTPDAIKILKWDQLLQPPCSPDLTLLIIICFNRWNMTWLDYTWLISKKSIVGRINVFCPKMRHFIVAILVYCQRDGRNVLLVRDDTLNNLFFVFSSRFTIFAWRKQPGNLTGTSVQEKAQKAILGEAKVTCPNEIVTYVWI